jgi:hypothetical protein
VLVREGVDGAGVYVESVSETMRLTEPPGRCAPRVPSASVKNHDEDADDADGNVGGGGGGACGEDEPDAAEAEADAEGGAARGVTAADVPFCSEADEAARDSEGEDAIDVS